MTLYSLNTKIQILITKFKNKYKIIIILLFSDYYVLIYGCYFGIIICSSASRQLHGPDIDTHSSLVLNILQVNIYLNFILQLLKRGFT